MTRAVTSQSSICCPVVSQRVSSIFLVSSPVPRGHHLHAGLETLLPRQRQYTFSAQRAPLQYVVRRHTVYTVTCLLAVKMHHRLSTGFSEDMRGSMCMGMVLEPFWSRRGESKARGARGAKEKKLTEPTFAARPARSIGDGCCLSLSLGLRDVDGTTTIYDAPSKRVL